MEGRKELIKQGRKDARLPVCLSVCPSIYIYLSLSLPFPLSPRPCELVVFLVLSLSERRGGRRCALLPTLLQHFFHNIILYYIILYISILCAYLSNFFFVKIHTLFNCILKYQFSVQFSTEVSTSFIFFTFV